MCRVRGDGDDRPALLTAKLAHRLLEQVERTANVDREGLLPVLLRELVRRPHTQNTRRVDQHVQAFKRSQHAATHVTHLRGICYVQRFSREGVVVLREGQIEPGHLRARVNKRQRGCVAYPLPRARHPDGFAAEIESRHHFTSRESSAHQASRVGFLASITKSISPCTLRQRAASAIMRTESRP